MPLGKISSCKQRRNNSSIRQSYHKLNFSLSGHSPSSSRIAEFLIRGATLLHFSKSTWPCFAERRCYPYLRCDFSFSQLIR